MREGRIKGRQAGRQEARKAGRQEGRKKRRKEGRKDDDIPALQRLQWCHGQCLSHS